MKGFTVCKALRRMVFLAAAVFFLWLPMEASAETHELFIAPNAHFTVAVGDTLKMTTLYTDTDDFDWYIGDNEEKALELEGRRSGSSATFKAVGPGVVTVNCVRTVKTTVSKPYAYYNPITNETETRYNVVTESTSYDCICIITIEDHTVPEITTQPSGMAAGSGQIASASVEAFDHSTLSYKWFVKDPDSAVFKDASCASSTYSFVMSEGLSGRLAYCVITDSKGNSTVSDVVTFSQITIRQQPINAVAELGEKIVVSVRASGSDLTYTWYVRSAGQPNFSKSSVITASYSCTMTKDKAGRELYCVIADSFGNSVKTDTVTMGTATYAAITEQPANGIAASGKKVSTKVTAIGDGLTYQWYVKNPGEEKFTKSSITSSTYSYTMTADKSGRQVYCIVKDKYGISVKSQTVTLSRLAFTNQPVSVGVDSGETATVSCKAEGDGLKYQWYVKNPGSSKFSKSSITSRAYAIRMTGEKSGRKVYCVVTDKYGNSVQSKTVTLKMHIYAALLTEPKSVRVAPGDKATVSVKAEGDGLTYQWYVASAGVKKYTKSSVTKSSYSLVMSAENSGRKAYCIVTDKYGTQVKSKTVTLNTAAPLVLVTDILPPYAFPGEEVSLTAEATGQGTLHYEWYIKKPQDTEWEKTSVTGNTYTVVMDEEVNGQYIRCVITDNYGQKVSTWERRFQMIKELIIEQQIQYAPLDYDQDKILVWVDVSGTDYSSMEYRWYYRKKNTSEYIEWNSHSVPSIEFRRAPAYNGLSVYCVISDSFGQSVTTDEVTLKFW